MKLELLRQIRQLVRYDKAQGKTDFELLSSMMEEVGELSRELKIEEKVQGNTYKQPDEGSIIESEDVIITALAMYFARGGNISELEEIMSKKVNKWESKSGYVPF